MAGLVLSSLASVDLARAADPGTAPALDPGVAYYEPKHTRAVNFDPSVPTTLEAWRKTPDGRAQLRTSATVGAAETPAVGTKRMWPTVDFDKGMANLKEFTLRGVGDNIEVWLASGPGPDGIKGTELRPGDCRASLPNYQEPTDAQLQSLIREYDKKILPTESRMLSVAPDRDGSKAPKDLMTSNLDFSGAGNRVVTLVDNIRDAQFYRFPQERAGVAGYFSPGFVELTDRNLMTIDSADWLHRTGPNPPHNPTSDPCTSRVGRSYGYEGTFAHEYQHLLQSYVDPKEPTFTNEGLSEYITEVLGYIKADQFVTQADFDAFIACFQGFRTMRTKFNPTPDPCGGPANSLTRWGDQGAARELLADYGTAHSFLLFLRDRFGSAVVERIHRDADSQGLASVVRSLRKVKGAPGIATVLADYRLMTLVDKIVGQRGSKLTGIARKRVSVPSLRAGVNLLNPAATGAAGVAANGADYVALRGLGAANLAGADLRSLAFSGDRTLPSVPLQWTVANQYPLPTTTLPAVPGLPAIAPIPPPAVPASPLDNPVLFAGNAPNTDASAVFEVTVPAANPLLTYSTVYNLEQNFDYGYTVVSTDGGKSYTTLTNALTAPGPAGAGFTGSAPVPVPMAFDLTPYAGQKVLLGFRFVSDPAINAGGWAVDDVRVGGQLISDGASTAALRTFTQIRPLEIPRWSLQIVGIDEAGRRVHVVRFEDYRVKLTKRQLKVLRTFPLLVAVVGYNDPAETSTVNALYTLTVNGLGQAGGR